MQTARVVGNVVATMKDATLASHKLLVRAGYVRRIAPGVYSWLPLGLRVLRQVERVVREEGHSVLGWRTVPTDNSSLGPTAIASEPAIRQCFIERNVRKAKDELAFDPGSPVLGNPTGDVTVVEFFDYRCPYCKRTAPVIDQLVKEDGRIRRVMKEFPILGPESLFASRVALAAKAQGKYEPLHRLLIGAKGALDQDTVMKFAKEAGLDMDRLKRDINAPAIDEILKKNRELAGQLEITGTPAFIIGKEFVPGAAELDTFKTIIARARKG